MQTEFILPHRKALKDIQNMDEVKDLIFLNLKTILEKERHDFEKYQQIVNQTVVNNNQMTQIKQTYVD